MNSRIKGKLIMLGIVAFFVLVISFGVWGVVAAVMRDLAAEDVQLACLDRGYPDYRVVDGNGYCVGIGTDGESVVVPLEIVNE